MSSSAALRRKPAPHAGSTAESPNGAASQLEDLPFFISRLHYNLVGLIERLISEQGLDQAELKPGMGLVLYTLFEHDDQIISDIAERVQLSKSTLSGLLRKMENADLIVRSRDAEDGRSVRIRLTTAAKRLRKRILRMHDELLGVLHGGLSRKQIDETKTILNQITQSIRRAVQDR